jgi:hypothetical protein
LWSVIKSVLSVTFDSLPFTTIKTANPIYKFLLYIYNPGKARHLSSNMFELRLHCIRCDNHCYYTCINSATHCLKVFAQRCLGTQGYLYYSPTRQYIETYVGYIRCFFGCNLLHLLISKCLIDGAAHTFSSST